MVGRVDTIRVLFGCIIISTLVSKQHTQKLVDINEAHATYDSLNANASRNRLLLFSLQNWVWRELLLQKLQQLNLDLVTWAELGVSALRSKRGVVSLGVGSKIALTKTSTGADAS